MPSTKSSPRMAVVTGAGSGIGRATALCLAADGYEVIATERNVDLAVETVGECQALGAKANAERVDVADESDVKALFGRLGDRRAHLACLVNSAGIRGSVKEAHELDVSDLMQVMSVNLVGTFLCQREALRLMYANGTGAIVNVASA